MVRFPSHSRPLDRGLLDLTNSTGATGTGGSAQMIPGNPRRGAEDDRQDQRRSNRGEGRKSRSRSRDSIPVGHRGTIATISGGVGNVNPTGLKTMEMAECQDVLTGANATPLGRRQSVPVITFDDQDLKMGSPIQDEPMVISVVAAEYKIERVLIDQGSSANILYWLVFRRMGL
ncbi:hypothetical protein CR513_31766, partial [Mucuna pruriens]